MAIQKKYFKISSGLKSIIGKDLITSDAIAVFELVKNSFDAHAKKVEVCFLNLDSDKPKIVIKDNGKGMNSSALFDRWLWVAYSAKKEGNEDYRDKISSNRHKAGAKGIGRFSCDRLGKNLKIYTRKSTKGKINLLTVNWAVFEKKLRDEFGKVPVEYSETSENPYKLSRGTVIEITTLRSEWDREKLLELRRSLEKLVNPNQENDAEGFSVTLKVPTERITDLDIPENEPWKLVNGPIRNFVFENLGLKATEITSTISEDGETVRTVLKDQGDLIYDITEENPFEVSDKPVKNVAVHVFALNRSAKVTFHRLMGLRLVDYGNIFLYKNGFRIHPFGDPGDDSFKIDRRKTQGGSRVLGLRDIVGRIEIYGENSMFEETTSRDGGLVAGESYDELERFLFEFGLRRLERFAIDVIKLGSDGDVLSSMSASPKETSKKIQNILAQLTASEGVLKFNYNRKILKLLKDRSEKSGTKLLKNFRKIAAKSGDSKLEKEAVTAEKRYKELAEAKQRAEAELREQKKKQDQTQKKLETEKRKNLYLHTTAKPETEDVNALIHWIKISGTGIDGEVDTLLDQVRRGKYRKKDFLESLTEIKTLARKILSVSRLVTRSDFNLQADQKSGDLSRYWYEYVNSESLPSGSINVESIFNEEELHRRFSPLEVSLIADNLVDNARKALAKNMVFHFSMESKSLLVIDVYNDGEKISKSMAGKLFELGISGRGGSGTGLSTCRSMIEGMRGEINFLGNHPVFGGAHFQMRFKK